MDPWDEQFINLPNQEELLELLLAANYLDIKSLIELCCAKVATMIKGTPFCIQANPHKKSGSSSASSTTSPLRRRPRSERRTSGQKSAPIDQAYHVITLNTLVIVLIDNRIIRCLKVQPEHRRQNVHRLASSRPSPHRNMQGPCRSRPRRASVLWRMISQ